MLISIYGNVGGTTAGFMKTVHLVYTPLEELQLDSKKCTGRYFNIRDDDLSSKQGSLFTFKKILIKIGRKYV